LPLSSSTTSRVGSPLSNRLWVPEEAGLSTNPISDDPIEHLASISALANRSETEIQHVRGRLAEIALDAARRQLEQLLHFCAVLAVDLVVLPECCIALQHVKILQRFAGEMTIVAGLHYARAADESLALPFEFAHARDRNAAIILGPKLEALVTKRHPAQGEPVREGHGPTVLQAVTRGGRQFHLGVAICLDYLHAGHGFGERANEVDVVAISALSRETEDFSPRRTRDYVRVFANHAAFGGARIDMPSLGGVGFVTNQGLEGLPAGVEGVSVVDFDRFQSRPSATRATRNALVARAPMLYRGFNDAADAIAGEMAKSSTTPQSVDESQLAEWLVLLENVPEAALLRENLLEVRRLRRAGTLSSEALELLGQYLSLTDVRTVAEVRAAQASAIERALRAEMTRSDPLPGSAEAWEGYRKLERKLESHVRSNYSQGISRVTSELGNVQQVFAIGLGPFDRDDAVRTLPHQLNVLRTFARVASPNVALDYRLATSRDAHTGQLHAKFSIACNTIDASEAEVEELRRGLHDQLRVILVDGWNLRTTKVEPRLAHERIMELRPQPGTVVPVKEDWSLLVDLLRSLDVPATVQLLCGTVEPVQRAERSASLENASQTELSIEVAGEWQVSAASFMSSLKPGAASLGIRILLGVDREPGAWLSQTVANELLGPVDFEIVELERGPILVAEDGEPALKLAPEQALRVLHPPYGSIQGRGLRGRRETRIPLPNIAFPADGITLGDAIRQTGRFDEPVQVRLEDNARLRHLYVVGKTGSGKTNLLKNLVRQDVLEGRPVAVIDPHGELVDYVLSHCEDRQHDVLFLDFGRREHLPVLNPLTLDIQSPIDTELAIEELVDIVVHRSSADYTGPVFEDMMRLALESVVHPDFPGPPSLLLLSELYQSEPARRWIQQLFASDELGSRWQVLNAIRPNELAEQIKWMLSKFAEMSREGVLRAVLGGHQASVSLEQTVYSGGVLLVKLPETTIGPRAASFIGSLIFSRIRRALFDPERREQLGFEPRPVHLYVDEFQKFVGGGFELMVAEARKFGLGLTVAHQNLRQLEAFSRFEGRTSSAMLESLLGNVGNLVVMSVGRSDGDRLASELGVSPDAVAGIGRFAALCRAVVEQGETDAFTLNIGDASAETGHPTMGDQIAGRMVDEGRWVARATLDADWDGQLAQLRSQWRRDGPSRPSAAKPGSRPEQSHKSSSFLDDWLKRRHAAPDFPAGVENITGVDALEAAQLRSAFGSLEELAEAKPSEIATRAQIEPRVARRVSAWARRRHGKAA
jgi:Helicase HerA, central domain